eukprot:17517-Amorphochlora_amoeboformis.AAC.1
MVFVSAPNIGILWVMLIRGCLMRHGVALCVTFAALSNIIPVAIQMGVMGNYWIRSELIMCFGDIRVG